MQPAERAVAIPLPRQLGLGWAFFERQANLWKRYWAWEVVWLLYGVVNTLAITFIAKEAAREGLTSAVHVPRLMLFLLIGTLTWAYLSAILDDMALVITWERWEGTIEHTFMTPVSRVVHMVGASAFGVAHAIVRTSLIMACALPLFDVSFAHASWPAAITVIAVGSVGLTGIGVLAGILPMLYPERGFQMSFMVQAVVLLVSGVYYNIDVLPGWLQVFSHISPATYMLDGIRSAVISGVGLRGEAANLEILGVFGVTLVPVSLCAFTAAERWAKKTGRLKRQG